jgi:hypothetical protein
MAESGGLQSAREAMAAPGTAEQDEQDRDAPARLLEVEGTTWEVTLAGLGMTGAGGDPSVLLGELVFTRRPDEAGESPEAQDGPSGGTDEEAERRMVLTPVRDWTALSEADLERAFMASRPYRAPEPPGAASSDSRRSGRSGQRGRSGRRQGSGGGSRRGGGRRDGGRGSGKGRRGDSEPSGGG